MPSSQDDRDAHILTHIQTHRLIRCKGVDHGQKGAVENSYISTWQRQGDKGGFKSELSVTMVRVCSADTQRGRKEVKESKKEKEQGREREMCVCV